MALKVGPRGLELETGGRGGDYAGWLRSAGVDHAALPAGGLQDVGSLSDGWFSFP